MKLHILKITAILFVALSILLLNCNGTSPTTTQNVIGNEVSTKQVIIKQVATKQATVATIVFPEKGTQSPTICPFLLERPKIPVAISSPESGANGRKYYFDSVSGADNNSGVEPGQAWKSLKMINSVNYRPGDTVYFKRGSTWTGTFFIWASGTEKEPIIFTSYGDTGELPTFRNPGSESDLTSAIRIKSDWVIVENVKVQEAQLAGIYINTGSDHNIIRNIEATLVGEGISVHGMNNKIFGNYIHDLTMVHNTQGGNDDYGAVGIWLFNSNNEVAYNTLINCKAPSYDYGEDGGAVEFYKDVNNSYIHHNFAYNTDGFSEIGGGSAIDNIIAYNLVINSGRLIGLHLTGKFHSDVDNLRVENNTIIDTNPEKTDAAIAFWGGSPTPTTVVLRNNVFYLLNYSSVASIKDDGSDFTHDNNIFYIPQGKLGFNPGKSERIADPLFTNALCGDFSLSKNSPAIDSGIYLGYDLDYLQNPVMSGKAVDIGAFEYQQK